GSRAGVRRAPERRRPGRAGPRRRAVRERRAGRAARAVRDGARPGAARDHPALRGLAARGSARPVARGALTVREHERANRATWDGMADWYQVEHGAEISARPDAWGAWRIPESELRVLPPVADRDLLELGCG